MINLTINGKNVEVSEATTVLDAARSLNINIPTLCHMDLHDIKFVNKLASCRVCLVEDLDKGKFIPSCATFVKEGMNIRTDSQEVIKARRTIVELLLSDHPNDCLKCAKNLNCQLQKLAHDLNIREIKYTGEMRNLPIDDNSYSLVRDPNKCILCRRCETMCNTVQTVGALAEVGRGFNTHVGSTFNRSMFETTCTFCGQCLSVCPTGALTEKSNIKEVWKLLESDKHLIVQVAPAVRVALGEMFGRKPGESVEGEMVTALRNLGFDKVFDTNFAADLTIMEEANEFVQRLNGKGKLPILTSCCPGWVNFMEQQFSDLIDIPSSCKSPHEMFGAIAKTYYAEKIGKKPEDIKVVSIMPCISKKYEAKRDELENEGYSDVDIVLTTRELGAMIKEAGIDFNKLEKSDFDNPMGESTGAGDIFGTSGGVIEATIRTAYDTITGEELEKVEFEDLRGLKGIKQAKVDINGREIKIAVANGLGNTRKLLEKLRNKEIDLDAIEVMACPGGCIGGGGQPYHNGKISILKERSKGLYQIDKNKELRKSYQNPYIKKLYQEYLGEVGSEKAKELLHTSYKARPKL
ncbi:NADH-dependent [FeFe] hydrogenase, group A6 [Anaerococcus hydrogenalis]|uniref:NADH:ubiquinone oxidoreductase n=1 Tax=Anaerococcus hydrogenalis TaxID=33029 RepID=A0A2N6UHT9_9FIRM|nr:NADH-dependent [FeFe] hydrogenase, group A6 [Anaerococcus hydrogenalis]MDK7695367.1 NADH-dependent [FeFe] hydrogenase, group A6 [Anaerococcus hydrogenalis]MDK7697126.1 NADH-dependent [FeFe] hydrogenase, group A6 [Anaerococcus hydrogenalis]MDK7708353.1 NADH-dependent [FeFe] hydrogenase, group A6 [Anaerococcus hydrogenalis]PMC81177.1 NADH:ubiquinone oxidoreductase [Anaerococcus hydrogenalis]